MWWVAVALLVQEQMSRKKSDFPSLTGIRGRSVDIHGSIETARLTPYPPAKYLSSVEEGSADAELVAGRTNSYSLSLAGGDTASFSGYSSLLSWANEDEFELEASNRVETMFNEISSALFEHQSTGSCVLDHECDEWSTTYPHLRVSGVQLLESEEEVMSFVAPDPFIVSRHMLEGLSLQPHDHSDLFQLCVRGHKIQPLMVPPAVAAAISSGRKIPIASPYEELIVVNGVVEEYFAFDAFGTDDLAGRKSSHVSKNRGLPPITPNACVKDTVGSQVFDLIWAEIVMVLQPLLQAMRGGADKHSISCTPFPMPHLANEPSSNLIGGNLQGKSLLGNAPGLLSALQDLVTIKPLPLQARPMNSRCHTSFASHDHIGTDGSLLLGNQSLDYPYGAIRTNRYTPLPSSRPDTMATGRLISGGWNKRHMATLKPLDKPRTPANLQEEDGFVCLRGQKISGSTPSSWGRSGQLPPIEDTVFDKKSPPPIRSSAQKARSTSLASSRPNRLENNSHSDMQQIYHMSAAADNSSIPAVPLRSETPKIFPPSSRRLSNNLFHPTLRMKGHNTPGYHVTPLEENVIDDNPPSSNKPQSSGSRHVLRGTIR